MEWKNYLQKEISCSCGSVHTCDIKEIIVEENAVRRLPALLKKYGYQKLCVVCDQNTEKVAGFSVYQELEQGGFTFQKIIFREEELVPNEEALLYLFTQVPNDCDLILAVGSGTINDLCRYVSYKMKTDYYLIGTAPSMDGFASHVSPLIIRHLKTTFEAHTPKVILGDLNILSEAPLPMIAAGVGDILGKYVCLVDWQLAHLVNGEFICPSTMELVRKSIEKVVENAEAAVRREKAAIAAIMEGLILSGIAMSYIGNSRPASGSEHHLSHYWEMMFLLDGEKDPLHGTKVGIGTVIALRLYEMLQSKEKQLSALYQRDFDQKKWEQEIKEAYGPAASGVLLLEEKTGKNSKEEVERRRETFLNNYETVKTIMRGLPKSEEIIKILNVMDAPAFPDEIQVPKEVFKRSIFYAKDLRNRFGLLQILFDFGLQEEFTEALIREIYK